MEMFGDLRNIFWAKFWISFYSTWNHCVIINEDWLIVIFSLGNKNWDGDGEQSQLLAFGLTQFSILV